MVYLYWTVLVAGFLHLAATLDYTCDTYRTLAIGESVSFATPNFPFHYRIGISCHWRFITPVNTIVGLECWDFDIRRNEFGCIDTFQFSPSGDLKNADDEDLCGPIGHFIKYTTSNTFDAHFNSDPPPENGPPMFHPSRRAFTCTVTVMQDTSDRQDCGKNNLPSRIIEGDIVEKHKWPWQVAIRALRLKSSEPHALLCGGSIISPSWILTAAHCVSMYRMGNWRFRLDHFYVSIGDHNIATGDDTEYTVHRYVIKVIVHRGYNDMSLKHDIAVLQLEHPVEYTHGIGPVCLPSNHPADLFIGENATVTGWGQTSTNGQISSKLREANLKIISNEVCNKLSHMNGLGDISKHQICAYDEEQNSCNGDSGGSLVWLDKNGNYQQIGIVSTGTGRGCVDINDESGVYTRVTSYIDWIQANTRIRICSN